MQINHNLTTLILSIPLVAYAGPIPDTGQTTCYDADGNVIDSCPLPGEDFYGQDAHYAINPPYYTKLDSNGKENTDHAPFSFLWTGE